MSNLLPPAAEDYKTQSPQDPTRFGREALHFPAHVGLRMQVEIADTETRIPSAFSRAYLFWIHLFEEALIKQSAEGAPGAAEAEEKRRRTLHEYHDEARQTLRGLLAAVALRKVLGLRFETVDMALDTPEASPIQQALLAAAQSAPATDGRWTTLRFLTVPGQRSSEPGQVSREVVLGLSPLTGLFPAAKPLTSLKRLFWYRVKSGGKDAATRTDGRWFDPTRPLSEQGGSANRFLEVQPRALQRVRSLMRAWLTAVLGANGFAANVRQVIAREEDAVKFEAELRLWLNELSTGASATPAAETEVVVDGMAGWPTFLSRAVNPAGAELLGAEVFSDLPVIRGRALVTRELLLDSSQRIFGREMGGKQWEAKIAALPPKGADLAGAMGLDQAGVQLPFFCADTLFTPRLAEITTRPLSKEWQGLSLTSNDGSKRTFLLPFQPVVLELCDKSELLMNTSLAREGDEFWVSLQFSDGPVVRKIYRLEAREIGDGELDNEMSDRLDVRLFPNFDLGVIRDGAPLVADAHDRTYYLRVRRSPFWDFAITPLSVQAQPGGRLQVLDRVATPERIDPLHATEQTIHEEDCAAFLEIADPYRPDALYFDQRGLVLINLDQPQPNAEEWHVGIDFGTTNTCVAYRRQGQPDEGGGVVLTLPILTTTLLQQPRYSSESDFIKMRDGREIRVADGAAAVLDFFYQYAVAQGDDELNPRGYFPTQWATQVSKPQPQGNPNAPGQPVLHDGVCYFRNTAMGDWDIMRLIEGFAFGELEQHRTLRRRFRLFDDLKWEDRKWREAYLRFLRKVVMLSAAAKPARIEKVSFSFPRAFNPTRRDEFSDDLRRIWSKEMLQPLQSESAAVGHKLLGLDQAGTYMVFDVGGGTTDLLCIHRRKSTFESSFQIAGRLINDYVTRQESFRRFFFQSVRAVHREARGEGKLNEIDFTGSEKLARSGWFAYLEKLSPADRVDLIRMLASTESREEQAAVAGFFLSLILLFGGVAYHGGRLLRAYIEGEFGQPLGQIHGVNLVWLGNGSRLITLLGSESELESVFGAIRSLAEAGFRAAGEAERQPPAVACDGVCRVDHHEEDPKTIVARGLVSPSALQDGALVAAQLKSDLAFYEGRRKGHSAPAEAEEVPHELQQFFDALDKAHGLKRLMCATPLAKLYGGRWTFKQILSQIYGSAKCRNSVQDLLDEDLAEYAKSRDIIERDGAPDEQPNITPVFVTRLRSLVATIRSGLPTRVADEPERGAQPVNA